jgi:ABC-2 type transport system permease protein
VITATVLRLAARLCRRGFLILLALIPGLSAVVVVQYRYTFTDPASIAGLEVLAHNPAIRTLFGVPLALDDPGAFTVWRTGVFAAVTAASWGLLTATRVTRGEEQAGRWSLLLAGRFRLSWLVVCHLAVIATAQLAVGLALALAMIAAGTDPRGAVIYACGVMLVGMFFAAVGTGCAQVVDHRRTASGIAAGALVLGLLLRMVADGSDALAGLSWLTPFGLLAEAQPYAGNRVPPLLVLAAGVVAAGLLAVVATTRRDLGAGLVTGRDLRTGRFGLLRSVPGFAIRRTLPATVSWAVGLGAYFLLIGVLARSLTEFLAANTRFADMAAQAGFSGLATVQGYAAALFALLAIPLGIFVASRQDADAADEADGRLTPLLALPLTRRSWALTQLGVLSTACIALALTTGLATWIGTTSVGAGLRLTEALSGTVNVVPVGLLCLAAAQTAVGWAPRAVLPIGSVPAVGGFLLTVLTQTFHWPDWVGRLSPFAHLASVPADPPNWGGVVGMVAIGLLLAGFGIAGFARRDLLA